MTAVLWLCFLLSGASALGLELLWMRSAGLVLGTTPATTATVVGAYFTGLAAGGWIARRPTLSPIRRYGRLELAVAAGALASWGAFRVLSTPAAQHALGAGGTLTRVTAVALVIVPVTLALGATLPTLSQALATPDTIGRRAGALYALNTLGAAGGLAVVGFGLPALIGVSMSYVVVAAGSAMAGLIALAMGDHMPHAATATTPRTRSSRRLWIVAAAAGAIGIALEILWTTLFAQVLHNSVYSFTAVALVFLVGIAAGAEIAALLLRFVGAARLAATSLIVAGVATAAGVQAFVYWTDGLRYFGMERGLAEYLVRIVALAAATAGPGTIAAGAVLPALWAQFGDRASVARPVGELTAMNLAGGVVGALGAAFVVLPQIGMRAGFLLAAVGYIVLAEATGGPRGSRRLVAAMALAGVALLNPLRAPLTSLNTGETLRAAAEGPAGIVTVIQTPDDLQLRLDNYYVLGGSAGVVHERRQGLVPLLLHPSPQHVAFIGMATGISASAAAALRVPDTTVIELIPEVAAMARTHFAPWNAGLLERPGVRLVVDDGRRYLTSTTSAFDVIVSDLFIPWHANAGNLYSVEMYEATARRLAPGGLFCQWLPLYQLTREEFSVIARTFLAVFPHVTLWRNDFFPDRPVLGLVGAREARPVDLDVVAARVRALPDWARDSLVTSPRALVMLYLGDLTAASDLFAASSLNRDDRPIIEFLAPRLTRMSATGDKDWLTGAALADFTDVLAARLAGQREPALPATPAAADARRAGLALFRYAVAARQGRLAEAERWQDEVRRLVPDVIASAEPTPPADTLGAARSALDTMQSEHERLRRQIESIEQRLGRGPGGGSSR